MAASLLQGVPLKARAIGLGIVLGPLVILVLLGAIFLRRAPIDPRLVWGCYVAEGAPALAIEADRIRVLDGTKRALSYVAEPGKEGYRLSVHPALQLKPSARGRYGFVQNPGTGYFWPLLTAGSDNPRSMRLPQDFGGRLGLVAADGTTVMYARSGNERACL
jgi:hypothetical protein